MSAHAPGPWRFVRSDFLRWTIEGPAEGRFTPIVASLDHVDSEADGRLMAAAPELLAALVGLTEGARLDEDGYVRLGQPGLGDVLLERARAAIAKATEEETR